MKSNFKHPGPVPQGTVNVGGRLLGLSPPVVMGILNTSPDSFYEGSRVLGEKAVLAKAAEMLQAGAGMLDIGGCSTRPGADEVPPGEEKSRVITAVRAVLREFPQAVVSVDTFRAETARAAVGEGALMVNDVSGGQRDPGMFAAVASLKVPYVLMHARGTPANMQSLTSYGNLLGDMLGFFAGRIGQLHALGCKDILVDPGFGFAKTLEQNHELMARLGCFGLLGKPLLVGVSRKSMIYKALGSGPENALAGTIALNTLALKKNASVLRVHDVREAVEIVTLINLCDF